MTYEKADSPPDLSTGIDISVEHEHSGSDRVARRKRQQRVHLAYTLAVFLLGVGIGYVIAHWVIDPVTVIPGPGGIKA